MVTLEPPVFVMLSVSGSWVPTVTLPKASLAGLGVSSPGAADVPVPETEKLVTEFEASLATVTLAVKFPAAFGENCTLIGTL